MVNQVYLTEQLVRLQNWLLENIWTMDAFIQGVLIFIAFGLSHLGYKSLNINLSKRINDLGVSFRAKLILHNILRLFAPFAAVVMLFIAELIGVSMKAGVDFGLIDAVIQLTLAWIVVRLSVQFIQNSFIRNIFTFTIWTIAALSILGVLDQTVTTLDAFGMSMGGFRLSLLTVVKGMFALFFLLYAAIFLASLLERRIQRTQGLTATSKVLINKIVRVTLVSLALLVGITTAGVDLSLLAVFGGAVGLGVGFGLQKGVSNLFSGMLLLLDKSIKPGDIIELEGTFGWVDQMGARYTSIVTRDNKSFLVPNEDFITQQVVNWSHGNTLVRLEVEFGVDYRSDPHKVKDIAEKAAIAHERICEDPLPICHLVEFGDSSLNFKLRFWIKDAHKGVTNMRGAVMLALWDAFKENDIAIPYPHREVYIHEVEKLPVPEYKPEKSAPKTK